MRVVAAVVVVVVEMEVVVEVGMKILDMGMTYSCKALLLSRPYPAVRVFFLHQTVFLGPIIGGWAVIFTENTYF